MTAEPTARSAPAHRTSPRELRRVAISSYLGNTVEYYDFLLYGAASALVFGPLFFPKLNPTAGTLAAFATLTTAYLGKPLGGIILGRLGDRIGRKRVLLLTIVLMGGGSGLIGVLPTYSQIGIAASILLVLLRLGQGFAVGGEWGGAALLAAEHAPPGKRGFVTAIGQAGLPSAGLLSTLALTGVALLPGDQLMSWGWRIPFLFSFVLLAVALYVRTSVTESPLFVELEASYRSNRSPVRTVLRKPRTVLRGILLVVPPTMSATLVGVFTVSYAVGRGVPRGTVLAAVSAGYGTAIVSTPVFGWLSDRFGRRPVYLVGALSFGVLVYPMFWAIGSGDPALMFLGIMAVFGIAVILMSAALAALLSEMFPTEGRFVGVSVSYQLGTVASGFTPLVAGSLLATAGGGRNVQWVVLLVVVLCVLAAAAAYLGRESAGSDLRAVPGIGGAVSTPAVGPRTGEPTN